MRTAVTISALMVVAGLTCCWGQPGITLDGDIEDIWNKSDAWTGTDTLDSDLYGYDIRRVAMWRYFYTVGQDAHCDLYIGVEVSGVPGDTDGDGDPDVDDDPGTEPTDWVSIGSEFDAGDEPYPARSEYVVIRFRRGPFYHGCGVDWATNWPQSARDTDSRYESKGYACGSRVGNYVVDDAGASDSDFTMETSADSYHGYEMVFRDFHDYVTGEFSISVATNAASGGEDAFSFGPTAVTLASAEAEVRAGAKRLLWETGAEAGLVGFNVWAAPNKMGPYERLNRRLLPTVGEGGVSGRYRYIDQTPALTRHQYYRVELVSDDGSSESSEPIEVSSPDEARVRLAAGRK